MTAARASKIRIERMKEGGLPNKERRKRLKEQKTAGANRWTFDRLWSQYQETNPIKGIVTDKNRYENHIKPLFGDKEPKDVLPLDADRLRLKMLKTHSPATVHKALELFRRIANYGVKKRLCPGLPFIVEMPTVDNEKTEELAPKQLESLLSVLDSHDNKPAARIMKLALFTGMRRGEILNLKWQDIDTQKGLVFISDPKGGESQKIPLSQPALDLLEQCPKDKTSPYVFPGRNGKKRTCIKRGVNAIKTKAGLPAGFRAMHGLRHVYASTLVENGIDLYQVQKLLTHKSPKMTARYSHLSDMVLKKAANTGAAAILSRKASPEKTGTEQE